MARKDDDDRVVWEKQFDTVAFSTCSDSQLQVNRSKIFAHVRRDAANERLVAEAERMAADAQRLADRRDPSDGK